MATRKLRKFSEGGEAADKEAGLKSSKDEKVGFFERMRMGNIDDPSSEAYRRFGAGRAKADRDAKSEADAAKAVDQARAQAKASEPDRAPVAKTEKAEESDGPKITAAMRENARKQGEAQPSGDAGSAESSASTRATPAKTETPAAKTLPAKSTAKPAAKPTSKQAEKPASKPSPNKETDNSSSSSSGKSKQSLVDQIPRDKATPVSGEKVDSTELSRNINNALNATPGIQVVGRMKGAGQAAKKAGRRALSTVDDGITFLGRSGGRRMDTTEEIGRNAARQIANNPTRQLPGPPRRLNGPSGGSAAEAVKKSSREDKTLNPLAWMAGPKGMADDFKRGGKVKSKAAPEKAFKAGGAVKGWGLARGARKAKIV